MPHKVEKSLRFAIDTPVNTAQYAIALFFQQHAIYEVNTMLFLIFMLSTNTLEQYFPNLVEKSAR